jgi:hypothetical protein
MEKLTKWSYLDVLEAEYLPALDVIQLTYVKKGAIRCIVHPKTRFQKLYILPCGKSMGSSGACMLFLKQKHIFSSRNERAFQKWVS